MHFTFLRHIPKAQYETNAFVNCNSYMVNRQAKYQSRTWCTIVLFLQHLNSYVARLLTKVISFRLKKGVKTQYSRACNIKFDIKISTISVGHLHGREEEAWTVVLQGRWVRIKFWCKAKLFCNLRNLSFKSKLNEKIFLVPLDT